MNFRVIDESNTEVSFHAAPPTDTVTVTTSTGEQFVLRDREALIYTNDGWVIEKDTDHETM